MNKRKEKQPQKRHCTQHCNLLFRFPKHKYKHTAVILFRNGCKNENKPSNSIIYLIFNMYILIKKPLNLQIHYRTKKKNTKLKYKVSSYSFKQYIYISSVHNFFLFSHQVKSLKLAYAHKFVSPWSKIFSKILSMPKSHNIIILQRMNGLIWLYWDLSLTCYWKNTVGGLSKHLK